VAVEAENQTLIGEDTALAEQSLGELVKSLTEATSTLVRDEIQLAGVELKEKGKHAAAGVGMFGGAGLVGAYAGGALITCLIAALSEVLALWAAALIVATSLFAVAGVLALAGRRKVKEAVPPAPEEALAGLHSDVRTVKAALR
jgi:uncharacterized membrane protein YqjE